MVHQPKDYAKFFRRVGPAYVRDSLVNGELTDETKERAELWLREHGQSVAQLAQRAGVVVGLVTLLLTLTFGVLRSLQGAP